MINIPQHLQLDFDSLSPIQQQKFMELSIWGSAGENGNLIISDVAFEKIFNIVKQMGSEPNIPIEPDMSVNHDWEFKFK